MAGTDAGPGDQGEIMTRIGQVIMLLHGGDREEARNRFAGLWDEIGEDSDPFHRCALAHYMADTQDDPRDELAWDLRALEVAGGLGPGLPDERVTPHHDSLAVRGFYPSLHLNLAADYWKLGDPGAAREHLGLAWDASSALGDDEYGDGIRAAIGRMELRLSGSGSADQLP